MKVASFGDKSRRHRNTCEPALQRVLNDAINSYDFSVIWGHRGEKVQNLAYKNGYSQRKWPTSEHNALPSRAFDVIPYPDGFDASDEEFYKLATHILSSASKLGVPLRWGGHWKNLKDLAHFELMD